jgi:3-deoxy-D-manno-octulosonate 8-phosphate phosphatase (KDO 8-P phosphatase)
MSPVSRLAAAELAERARGVRMVLMDVDGVLTDGRLYLGSNGAEARAFHVRDGLGIRLGQLGGLSFGIISGRDSSVVAERAAELSIAEVHQGVTDKAACLERILDRLRVPAASACFIGDDLPDLPAMRRVGLSAAPADAAPEVQGAAHFVTAHAGGGGAVRDVVDLVLRCAGAWDSVLASFTR